MNAIDVDTFAQLSNVGFRPFALKPHDKPPLSEGWRSRTLEEDFLEVHSNPGCNLGTKTGDGLVCIDLDMKPGVDGRAALAAEQARLGCPLPKTVAVETPTGGLHLYYRSNAAIRNSASKVAPGVDIRGEGGLVVLPPSVHPKGGEYRWADGCSPQEVSIATLPAIWESRLEVASQPKQKALVPPTQNVTPEMREESLRRCRSYVEKMDTSVSGKGGHNQTFSVACHVVERTLCREDAEQVLEDYNERCDPPWSKRELQHKLDGAEAEVGQYGAAFYAFEAERTSRITPAQADPSWSPPDLLGKAKQDTTTEAPTLGFKAISMVQKEQMEWVVPLWVAKGKLHILQGDKGTAKSTVLLDFASAMTAGRSWLGGAKRPPAVVAIVAQEDGVADTIRWKLEAMGADLDKFLVLDNPLLNFPNDLAKLEADIVKHRIEYLIIDSMMSVLGRLDAHKDQDVRTALMPLMHLLERTGCTAFAIRHLNKDTNKSAAGRGMGSVAFAAIARIVWMCGRDPNQLESDHSFVLTRCEGNLGRPPKSRLYETAAPDPTSSQVTIAWGEETDLRADDLVGKPDKARAQREGIKTVEALDFLTAFLKDGPVARKAVIKAGEAQGISRSTLDRVKKNAGIVIEKDGCWSLDMVSKEAA